MLFLELQLGSAGCSEVYLGNGVWLRTVDYCADVPKGPSTAVSSICVCSSLVCSHESLGCSKPTKCAKRGVSSVRVGKNCENDVYRLFKRHDKWSVCSVCDGRTNDFYSTPRKGISCDWFQVSLCILFSISSNNNINAHCPIIIRPVFFLCLLMLGLF